MASGPQASSAGWPYETISAPSKPAVREFKIGMLTRQEPAGAVPGKSAHGLNCSNTEPTDPHSSAEPGRPLSRSRSVTQAGPRPAHKYPRYDRLFRVK